jgi:LysR family transcriptional regulator, transcriptional activator for bauABCD operon
MLDRPASKFLWNLDWNLLKTFSAIVQNRGVSRAATSMARQQPAVSSALKRLEDYLGVTLCRRGPGGFELTEEGRALAAVCTDIERQLSSVPGSFDEISAEVMSQIRLIMVGNLVSPRLDQTIAGFSRRYPRSELFINVAPCTEIEARVLNCDVEIAVGPLAKASERLYTKLLYREQHVAVCGSSHPLCGKLFNAPAALSEEAFVLPGRDEAVQVVRYREKHRWGRVVAGESLDLNEVRRMVIAGLGIALLPVEFLEPDLNAGRLHLLMPPDPEAQDDIFVIVNPESPRRHAVARFLELMPD